MQPTSVFVTGTDTGVGKTLVSAALCRAWGAAYWKPIQTGAADGDDDTATVAALSGARVYPPARVYRDPSAPERAAHLEATRVTVADVLAARPDLSAAPTPLVVEGAGGVLVPINDRESMLDLMAALGLPVVIAARSALGTINHTLLTVGAARARGLEVAGVILSGPLAPHNRDAIERHGGVAVLAELPPLAAVTPGAVQEASRTLFRGPRP